jgi:mRNA-degrading endonuclease RelE of RelBE toxin-antitoxin system
MRYEIVLAPEAVQDLKRLRAPLRAMVRDAIEKHLRHQPTRTGRSGVKRLRGVSRPQYRLRVGDVRIFYDVSEDTVEVLSVVLKSEADAWLRRGGGPT